MNKLTKYKLFWAYEHEEEEEWLNNLSAKGWHYIGEPKALKYIFAKNPEKKYIYRLDYDPDDKQGKKMAHFYSEMGWENIGKLFNGWYYFRKETKEGENHQLYSDTASKIELYKRIRKTLLSLLWIPIIPLIPLFSSVREYGQTADYVFISLYGIFLLVYAVTIGKTMYKITRKIKNVEKGV